MGAARRPATFSLDPRQARPCSVPPGLGSPHRWRLAVHHVPPHRPRPASPPDLFLLAVSALHEVHAETPASTSATSTSSAPVSNEAATASANGTTPVPANETAPANASAAANETAPTK